jgi:hypothetical protein
MRKKNFPFMVFRQPPQTRELDITTNKTRDARVLYLTKLSFYIFWLRTVGGRWGKRQLE